MKIEYSSKELMKFALEDLRGNKGFSRCVNLKARFVCNHKNSDFKLVLEDDDG